MSLISHPASISILMCCVLYAAYQDVTRLRIPNHVVLILLGTFPAVALLSSIDISWENHLLAFGITLGFGFILYLTRMMGAGDIKLMAALSLWVGMGGLPDLIFWIAISGLFLGLALSLVRLFVERSFLLETVNQLPKEMLPIFQAKGPVPYGVAIAAGFVIFL